MTLFAKRRLVREVCHEKVPRGHDARFTPNSLKALQEAAENFIVETFHKSDLARLHAGRETLSVNDIRFSRFMKPDSMWVMTDRMYEKNFFAPVPLVSASNQAKLKLRQEEAAFKDVNAIEKKLKMKKAAASSSSPEAAGKEAESKKAEDNGAEAESAEGEERQEDAAAEGEGAGKKRNDSPENGDRKSSSKKSKRAEEAGEDKKSSKKAKKADEDVAAASAAEAASETEGEDSSNAE